MVQYKDINAYVVRAEDNVSYEEYKVPRGKRFRGEPGSQVYIEAVTGERFAIVAECMPDFDWKRTRALQIQFWIDNRDFFMAESLCKSSLNQIDPSVRHRHVRHESETWLVDGKWMSCGLAFADVQIDEDSVATAAAATFTAATPKRGVIHMTIEDDEKADLTIPKHLVKTHVSHAIKNIPLEEAGVPQFARGFAKARGEAGNSIDFFFHYRSRNALQLLNIIPDDPTAAADAQSQTQNVDGLVGIAAPTATATTGVKRKSSANPHEATTSTRVKCETIDEGRIKQESSSSLIKSEYEDNIRPNATFAMGPTPANQQPTTTRRTKQKPVSITIDDDDDDIQIVDARPASSAKTISQPAAPVTVAQGTTFADSDRKKRLLKMRLEELRIERELMELA
ncbi:hypothetical protein Q7P37_010502 [Cladosporium fusiforme]